MENKLQINTRKKWVRRFRRLSIFLFIGLILASPIFADEGDKYLSFYKNNADILKTNTLFLDALRAILWYGVIALVKLGQEVQKLYDTAFGFIDLTANSDVTAFVNQFKPVFIALTAIALVYLGIILILHHDKKPNVVTNIVIAALCVSCSTFIFSSFNSLLVSFKDGVNNTSIKSEQEVYTIVNNNSFDVLKLYNKYGTGLNKGKYANGKAGINKENFGYFNINEVINYKSKLLASEENPFKYRIGYIMDGKAGTVENSNGWGINENDDADFGNEFYYRYSFQFLVAYIQLIALIVVYLAMSYKVVRVAFELVVARLLAYLYSAELSGGEKIKKILAFIRDSYILLAVSIVCIKVYVIFTTFITKTAGTGFTAAIFSLFLAFTVIDGPNLVERVLGMDAGLKSSTARMMAVGGMAVAGTRAATNLGKGVGRKIGGTLKNASDKKAADIAKAGATGAALGAPDDKEKNTTRGKDGSGGTMETSGISKVSNTETGSSGSSFDKDVSSSLSTEGAASSSLADRMDSALSDKHENRNLGSELQKRDHHSKAGSESFNSRVNNLDRQQTRKNTVVTSSKPRTITRSKSKFMDKGDKK